MASNVVLRGINNAIVKCGSTPAGFLASVMWYINITGDNNTISDITFLPPNAGFSSLGYGAAAIFITGGKNLVSSCIFSFSFAYDLGVFAVWCTSNAALYNKIINNKCYTVGIQYAENEASYTFCDANLIINASTDGLSGTGNGTSACIGNLVSNNVVIGSGWSGIEDFGDITGSIISSNVVLNSGQAPGATAAGQGMGISAVGTYTQIIGNEINGFLNYGIEAGNNKVIENNMVTDPTGLYFGIFINANSAPATTALAAGAIVNNTIIGCATAIEVEGDYNNYLNISGNSLRDFINTGIFIQTDGLDISINIVNNTLILTAPNALSGSNRIGVSTYTNLTTINGFLRICNNNICYLSSAGGGTGLEIGFLPLHSGTLLENNVVNTNNISTSGTTNVYTYSDFGNPLDAMKYVNNKSIGTHTAIDLNASINIILIGNNWTGGDTMVFIDTVKTATNAAYTIAAAGTLTKLPIVTANRIVTLPAASANAGRILKIWNQNTSTSFHWSFSGVVKDATNATITTLVNTTWYILESDGANWNKTN
jgi:hypothetical protein